MSQVGRLGTRDRDSGDRRIFSHLAGQHGRPRGVRSEERASCGPGDAAGDAGGWLGSLELKTCHSSHDATAWPATPAYFFLLGRVTTWWQPDDVDECGLWESDRKRASVARGPCSMFTNLSCLTEQFHYFREGMCVYVYEVFVNIYECLKSFVKFYWYRKLYKKSLLGY